MAGVMKQRLASRNRGCIRELVLAMLVLGALVHVCSNWNVPIAKFVQDYSIARSVTRHLSVDDFKDLQDSLFGPDEYGTTGCPPKCGCHRTGVDCPQHYELENVNKSATALLTSELKKYVSDLMETRKTASKEQCSGESSGTTGTGGWCLKPGRGELIYPNGHKAPLPDGHVHAPAGLVANLNKLIKDENISSLIDFGAGVGQYGLALANTNSTTRLDYTAYDGAGNVEEYTGGFVKFADFTIPLNLPVADWVLSLEVGEHISSRKEGMFIRNLHRHNCRGIILSWAVLGQNGFHHINNHDNTYLESVFHGLGYYRDHDWEQKFRTEGPIFWWFKKSIMVFRRNKAVC